MTAFNTLCRAVLMLTGIMFWHSATAAPTHTLVNNRWSMLALPTNVPGGNTVADLFAAQLPIGDYGADGDWVVFAYSPLANSYTEIASTATLQAGKGYWMIQTSGIDISVSLPATTKDWPLQSSTACPQVVGCNDIMLVGGEPGGGWNLLGYPQEQAQPFGNTRLQTSNGTCANGCTPDAAEAADVMHNMLFHYNGTEYEEINSGTSLQPWEGFWARLLPASGIAPHWLVPAAGAPTNPNAERDASRLLAQATFGPTRDAIAQVLAVGGPADWIDAQIALPPTYHLPMVHSLADDGWGNRLNRYQAFWQHSLRADDQLRQRVAFALSEIMVISDVPAALINHGNMVADFYDLLLENAFGNYRELLEAVTLSPAMGVYLSMLGNDKPDTASGRRADENYAREVMQLFSIGLVRLNRNGSVKLDTSGNEIPAYTQTDVENLANTFTGWSWDRPEWKVNPVDGWYPDKARMERPMKAFPEHHDKRAKAFLGATLAAGQTPEQDMAAALDTLHGHPNVAPFISRQLIQRLVTSNPAPGYITRVASVFNDNGQGTRGDLAAVVKAVLMDEEARSVVVAANDRFGKLREPLLRLSHLWRAFNMSNPTPMHDWKNELSQHAPLTANSVFNFFAPDHSPSGTLMDAGLVAPEFQINSESYVNKINGAMMWVIQRSSFFNNFPTELDLSFELALLDTPAALLEHLDLLLFSGSIAVELRQLVLEYIAKNRPEIGDDRTLRDVIALLMTSANYSIQR